MKTITLLFLLLLLLLSTGIYAQKDALDSCHQNFLIARATTAKVRDSLKVMTEAKDIAVSRIAGKDSIIQHLGNNLKEKDTQIELLKNQFSPVIPPMIVWQGFYAGVSAQYNFADSILTRTTFINGIFYSIEGTASLMIANKVLVNAVFGIPLNRNKVFIKVVAGWRVF